MGSNMITVLIIAIVTAIIGFAIIDSVTADTLSPGSMVNESIGTANGTGYLAGTIDYTPLASTFSGMCNGTVTTNVSQSGTTITVSGADCISATVLGSYSYDDATYLSGSLSRTIIQYVVPIGLLAVLGMAAFFSGATS